MNFFLSLLIALPLLAACNSKKDEPANQQSERRQQMEKAAAEKLRSARTHLAAGRYEAARNDIKAMRKDCYLAITARQEGIILMDSVDLAAAQSELISADSVLQLRKTEETQAAFEEACRKVEFFKRKIQHDHKAKNDAGH